MSANDFVAAAGRSAAHAPNLVFVFADQMRGSAMGFLGEEPVLTPNLDRLAKQAVVFTQAASNYPVCSPYRAMLMTGQQPTHTLYDRRADPYQLKNIADEQPGIVKRLIRDELDPWLIKTHDPWRVTK